MTIPNEALVLSIDADRMTLNEMEMLLEPDHFRVSIFKAFMVAHSNWTADEIGGLTLGELKDVSVQIGRALTETALPKESAPA